MLFALRQPAILLGLAAGFVLGVVIRAAAQRRLAAGGGLRRTRMRRVGAAHHQPWTGYLDPYGVVAAVVAGVGWGARVPQRSGRTATMLLPLVAALVVHGVLAAAGFAAYRASSGPEVLGTLVPASDVLHGSVALGSTAAQVAVGFGVVNLACGLLALVPIPPLELGVVVWSRLPKTAGARRFAYHLLEEAWGVLIVLVGLLLPLAGQRPVLLALIDIVANPLLRLV